MNYKDNPKHLRALYPKFKQYGISGTRLSSGVIAGYEQNPSLTSYTWIKAAEEMLRTDPIISQSWYILKQTLLSATWRFKPGIDGDPLAEKLCDYANQAYGFNGYSGQMSISFEDQLSYLLEFIPLGYRYAEEIYKYGSLDKDGNPRVWLDRYADREPSSHYKWLSRDNQILDGVLQQSTGYTKNPDPIPANKLLLLTLGRTGNNFEGKGLLRPIWWCWNVKQKTANSLAIALDRWSIPTPKMTVDRSKAELGGYSDSDIDAMIEDGEEQLRAFISGEQSYLIENSCVTFDSYAAQPNLYSQGPNEVIKLMDNQISQGFNTQFTNLGISDTGARSVGEVHVSIFRRSAINLCDRVASQISGKDRAGGGTIGRLIGFNFGYVDPSRLPKLIHDGLDTDHLAESLQMIPNLIQSGLLTPTDSDEQTLRNLLGLNDLPENAERSTLERSASNPQSAGAALLAEQLIQRKRLIKNG
tara:strand:+ start:5808 stop:7223 length:1416 start_codon:yes stop_codon:yes gene_type:complete